MPRSHETATDSTLESQKRSSTLSRGPTPLHITEEARPLPLPRSQRPDISRTPSTATVTQVQGVIPNARRPSQVYSRSVQSSKQQAANNSVYERSKAALGSDGTSDSEADGDMSPRQPSRRSPRIGRIPLGTLSSDGDADDDDEDEEGFLPFAARPEDEGEDDPTATLISPPRQQTSTNMRTSNTQVRPEPQDSSASSTTSSQPRAATNPSRTYANLSSPDTLSPQQRAQLSRLSPRYKNVVSGSEGSPSMGSSFSDLDDLSVTRSAMQDALVSRMQHGGSIGMGLGSLIDRARTRRDGDGRNATGD